MGNIQTTDEMINTFIITKSNTLLSIGIDPIKLPAITTAIRDAMAAANTRYPDNKTKIKKAGIATYNYFITHPLSAGFGGFGPMIQGNNDIIRDAGVAGAAAIVAIPNPIVGVAGRIITGIGEVKSSIASAVARENAGIELGFDEAKNSITRGVDAAGQIISTGVGVAGHSISTGVDAAGQIISTGVGVAGRSISTGVGVAGHSISTGVGATGRSIKHGVNVARQSTPLTTTFNLLKTFFKKILNSDENTSIRIVLSAIFILFIYFQVLGQVFIFFGVSQTITNMYLVWLGIFMLFVSILPYERSVFKIDLE